MDKRAKRTKEPRDKRAKDIRANRTKGPMDIRAKDKRATSIKSGQKRQKFQIIKS